MTLLLLADAAVTAALTTVHLLVIAVLMAIVVFGMIWGARQKRRRVAAEEEADTRQVELADAPPSAPVEPTPIPLDPEAEPAAGTDVPLTRLKGLGPKAAALLGERGIADIAALAALSDAQATTIDADLGTFSGRLSRDRWVEQAKLLTAGDIGTYERKFGKLS